MLRRMITALAAIALLTVAAIAQPGPTPGPGPTPNPWVINGAQIYLPGQQCIVMPQTVTGGCKGNNSINAAAIYVNNSPVLTAATGASIIIGTTAITGGTNARVIYDNAGVAGEYTTTQLTAQINLATASLSGALPAWPGNTTTFFRGDGSYQTLNCAALTPNCITGNQTITLSGDVTGSGTTAITTTLANIPSGVPMAGSIIAANIAAPSSPAAAHVALYADSTDLRFHDKNASGVIGTTVVSDTGAANNFLTGITTAGAITKARPTCANLSDSSGGCSMSTTAGGDLSGTLPSPTVAKINGVTLGSTTATAGNVLIGSGTQWVTQAITGAVSLTSGGVTALTSSAFANPTALVGLAAVNGSATTAMRSDGAPALDQSIAPTWTGKHTFTQAATIVSATGASFNEVVVTSSVATISGNTGSPITALHQVALGGPTFTGVSAVTVTDASTLAIATPTCTGSVTCTNIWALRVITGATSLQNVVVNGAPVGNPASGQGFVGAGSTNGLTLAGTGSTFDVVMLNQAGNIACGVITNSLNINCGAVQVTTTPVLPSTNSRGSIGATAANGLQIIGQGSSFDLLLLNKSNVGICSVATGTTTLSCVSVTVTTPIALTSGGTNNSLTASNGGIVYSDASKLNILAGTVTANQCLLSGSNAAPSWGSCAGGAAVSSVTNVDGTLTISPTTGAVVASIALGHANTWTAAITDTVAPPQIILGVNTTTGGAIKFFGSTSGNLTLQPAAAAGSTVTLTMPGVTDTIAVLGTNQTHSATQTFSGTLNVSGTFQSAGNTMTFPGSAATLAALTVADQTVTGGANVTSQSQSTGNITVDCGSRPLQFITNNGAFTITAPANDGSCLLLITNGASANTVTFSGFTVGSATGGVLTTTNTNKFTVSIWRVNSISGYTIYPHQ